jgi:hypothetical protein
MKSRPSTLKSAHITRIFLLVSILLSLESPGVMASPLIETTDTNTYSMRISQSKDPICVGDVVNVTIQWGPNTAYPTDSGDGLAYLTPLAGPSRIKLQASLGQFEPDDSFRPGSNSGTKTVTYIAEKEGNEKILAQVWIGERSDATASDTFKIQACNYKFTLNAVLNLDVQFEDISYSTQYTVKSHGLLKPPDPDKPLNLESKMNRVKLGAVMTSFSAPKCTLFTYEPATGAGFVDARADPAPSGIGMMLILFPPEQLAWDVALSYACDGESHTLAGVYPSTSEDPWVSATFPTGSGQQTVKLDMFEIPMNKMNGGPGVTVSYHATLTLEKEAPK